MNLKVDTKKQTQYAVGNIITRPPEEQIMLREHAKKLNQHFKKLGTGGALELLMMIGTWMQKKNLP